MDFSLHDSRNRPVCGLAVVEILYAQRAAPAPALGGMALLASTFMLVLTVTALTLAASTPREAGPGDMSLSVPSLVPEDGEISAHEPLIARLKLTNRTDPV